MPRIDRRTFLQSAVAIGATAAWASPLASASQIKWNERRDLFPEGVASGDPDSTSVLLWTRRPYAAQTGEKTLHAEIAEDSAFTRIVATSKAPVSAESDWTCRILAGGLKPSTVYWYRSTDPEGNGSRIGRTITAPSEHDDRPVRFAFVSCQNANQGAMNAYRNPVSHRTPALEVGQT